MKPPSPSPSPTLPRPPKRIRLESSSPSPSPTPKATTDNDKIELVEGDHCSVCLQQLVDRTVIPTCAHEFCFECILVWTGQFSILLLVPSVSSQTHTEQSRRCPLCSQRINEYLIHHIRSKFDYQKHYLAPLRTSPPPLQSLSIRRRGGGRREGQRRERPWGRRGRRNAEDIDEADELERAIARRKWVYDHGLYAKVRLPRPVFVSLCVIDWLCWNVVVTARSVKLIYAVPPIPIPRTILFLARFDNTDDHFSEEGTQGMDEFRCRGSYLSPCLPSSAVCVPFVLVSCSIGCILIQPLHAVFNNLHTLPHEIHRYPLRGSCEPPR